MKNFKYYANCGNIPKKFVLSLEEMVDKAKTISYKTFIKHVDLQDIKALFPFYPKFNLHIQNDFAVGFYKSTFNGKTCYFIDHSSIEYIFLAQ